jgi:hypothetical protein
VQAQAEWPPLSIPWVTGGPRAPFELEREFAVQAEKVRNTAATQLAKA